MHGVMNDETHDVIHGSTRAPLRHYAQTTAHRPTTSRGPAHAGRH